MFSKEKIFQLFDSFKKLKILVIGDVMLDAYILGTADRISPEAPVPIVSVKERNNRLGGAANVAVNIKSLGAEPIICSVIGKDEKSNELIQLMKSQNISTHGIIKSAERKTTTKFRIIANHMQILRVDEEITNDLSDSDESELLKVVKNILNSNSIDAVIFQDYNKGVLTENIISEVIDLSTKYQIVTAVDPKKNNFLAFKNATFFKPNLKEIREGLNLSVDPRKKSSLEEAAQILHEKLNVKYIMVTLSELGVFISLKNHTNDFSVIKLPAHVRSIADVSGAGDTVIATATICLALKQPPECIATLSNLSGGLVCEELGVVPINKEKFLKECINLYSN